MTLYSAFLYVFPIPLFSCALTNPAEQMRMTEFLVARIEKRNPRIWCIGGSMENPVIYWWIECVSYSMVEAVYT